MITQASPKSWKSQLYTVVNIWPEFCKDAWRCVLLKPVQTAEEMREIEKRNA
jgi:hypothetical protein